MQAVRIIEIPDCKMVSSGIGMFGEEKFDRFGAWFSTLPQTVYPGDFLFFDGDEKTGTGGLHWLYLYDGHMNVPPEFAVINFKGGLYAVATDIDQQTDMDAMKSAVDLFLLKNGLKRDDSRKELGNIITSEKAKAVLGYCQMDYYTPIEKGL